MAKFTMKSDSHPEDTQEIEVADFAEATLHLVKDLLNTSDTLWGVLILGEWLELWRDSPKNSPITITKTIGCGEDSWSFIYDPS